MKQIKGIMYSELDKEHPVNISVDWELDTVTLTIVNKDEEMSLIQMECNEFFAMVGEIMPGVAPEKSQLSKEDIEDIEEDLEYMDKNPIKNRIKDLHKLTE